MCTYLYGMTSQISSPVVPFRRSRAARDRVFGLYDVESPVVEVSYAGTLRSIQRVVARCPQCSNSKRMNGFEGRTCEVGCAASGWSTFRGYCVSSSSSRNDSQDGHPFGSDGGLNLDT